jgi:chromosome segregation ATPase
LEDRVDTEELIAQAKTQYSLDDVERKTVETVSVLAVDELSKLIDQAVKERTQRLKQQLADMAGAGGDGLEAEAAEAALEAEAVALEAKADAEQRTAQAESESKQLRHRIEDLEEQLEGASSGDAVAVVEKQLTEAKAKAKKDLEDLQADMDKVQTEADSTHTELVVAKADVERLNAQVKELETELGTIKESLESASEKLEPVTAADRNHAKRLAEAFLEEIFMDDEDKSNKAIKDKKAAQVFEKEIAEAYKRYIKRVKPAVRAEGTAWEEALAGCLKREW